jgi:hypothetical protein
MLVAFFTRKPSHGLDECSENAVVLPHFPWEPHPVIISPTSFVWAASL